MPYIELDGKRILYIHVPKTGGTSVEAWLDRLGPMRLRTIGVPPALRCTAQHLRYDDIEDLFGADAFDYAFMTVRNPFDRMASEYRMQAELAQDGFFREMPRFTPWLERSLARCEREPFVLDNHIRPQWEFMGDDVEVFRLEDGLETALARVAERIGVAPPESVAHALKTGKGGGGKAKTGKGQGQAKGKGQGQGQGQGKWARQGAKPAAGQGAKQGAVSTRRPVPPVRWTKTNIRRMVDFYAGDFEEFGYSETPPGA